MLWLFGNSCTCSTDTYSTDLGVPGFCFGYGYKRLQSCAVDTPLTDSREVGRLVLPSTALLRTRTTSSWAMRSFVPPCYIHHGLPFTTRIYILYLLPNNPEGDHTTIDVWVPGWDTVVTSDSLVKWSSAAFYGAGGWLISRGTLVFWSISPLFWQRPYLSLEFAVFTATSFG